MPHPSAPGQRAAAAPSFSGLDAARRRHTSTSAELLQRLSSRLDVLIRDVSIGATSHRQHDAHVDEAEAIAGELRAVFRQATPRNPANQPLQQQGNRAWW